MPLNVVNDSGCKFGWLPGRVPPRPLTGTFFVKATLAVKPSAVAEFLGLDDMLDPNADIPWDDLPANSPRYASDYAIYKPACDLLLAGHAVPPQGKPLTNMLVRFAVGDWTKSLAVFGDRVWAKGIFSSSLGAPIAFEKMRLCWEKALGGKNHKPNPLGRGIEPVAVPGVGLVPFAPNIELADELITSASARPTPAGFGPIPQDWQARMSKAGSYRGKWVTERWPWFPDDFDWTFFNAAPADQQVPFLKGDEYVTFEGMHPTSPVIQTRLPGVRMRWFIRQTVAGKPTFEEVPLHIDTLWVDADNLKLVVIWRGLAGVQSLKMREITDFLIVREPLGAPVNDLAYYEAMLERRKAELAAEGKEPEEPEEPWTPPEKPEPMDTSWADELEKEAAKVAQQQAQLHGQIQPHLTATHAAMRPPLGPRMTQPTLPALPGTPSVPSTPSVFDPGAAKAAVAAAFNPPVRPGTVPPPLPNTLTPAMFNAELDKIVAAQKALEAELKANETAEAAEEEEAVWTRERVIEHHKAAKSFKGEDLSKLDLSGLDLTGADFSEATLEETLFNQAILDRAKFHRASADKASFKEASLKGADFTEGDFHEADFTLALCHDALLKHADFGKSDFPGASFDRAKGLRPDFADCNLEQAKFPGADLNGASFADVKAPKADFSKSTLTDCDFDAANLAEANFSQARIRGIRFSNANLTGANLSEAQGKDTVIDYAKLDGADLRAVNLPNAWMEGSSFKAAQLQGALLVEARLPEADLTRAQIVRANLFRASFENANLSFADMRGANCYEAEFLQALIEGTQFDQANLKGTKLAHAAS